MVKAGGWATVGITEMPEQIVAGKPFAIEFMVWQHGNKPVHVLQWDNNRSRPITPQVTLTSADDGQTVTFTAQAAKQKGLFVAEITVPAEGSWEWSIAPDPLAGVSKFDSLTVLPASKTLFPDGFQSPAALGAAVGFPPWIMPGVLLFAGLLFLIIRSRRSQQRG